MSNYSFEYLQVLITRAVLDAKFRTDLLRDPLKTGKDQAQIDLTTTDGHLITLLASDIQRVSANQIAPEDAKNWSVGVLMTAIARICDQCWTLAFLDIPAKPHKPAFNIPAKFSKVKNAGEDAGSPA